MIICHSGNVIILDYITSHLLSIFKVSQPLIIPPLFSSPGRLVDPMHTHTYTDLWQATAKANTEVYEHVFPSMLLSRSHALLQPMLAPSCAARLALVFRDHENVFDHDSDGPHPHLNPSHC